MLSKKVTRRDMLKMFGLAAAGVVVAACAPKPAEQPTQAPASSEATQAPASSEATQAPTAAATTAVSEPAQSQKQMTILHWAQSAEPTDPNAQLDPGTVKHVAYQNIADAYTQLHPNIKIEWYRFPAGSDYAQWLQARITAQDCPDIFWGNTEDLWPHVSQGWILDFTESMNQPNPYVAGNQKWMDQFQDIAIISQTGPDGKLYGVNMDGAGVMTVYNKKAFADAGIVDEPKTWGDFAAAWKKLLDKGYIPYGADISSADCCFPHWYEAHVYNQLLWDKIYQWDDDKNKVITAQELATHFQKGDFPDWNAFVEMAHLLKSMVPYFPVGYQGQLDYRTLWRQGKVVMYMEGNWAVSQFKASPPPFEFGWLAFPIITKDIWPAAPEKVVRIQGAWGAMQYHMPGYLAQKDPDKVTACMDWLMYSSKPENVTQILKETGMVPLTKGAEGMPELAPFNQPYDRAVPYQSWQTLSTGGLEAEYKVWQQYLPNEMTDDALISTAKDALKAEVDKVLEANPSWKIS